MEAVVTPDPTKARYVKSYEIRRAFADEVQYPPVVSGVRDAIDIHCHAHEGQQDALAVAKHASKNGMRGILYKTIVGRERAAEAVRDVQEELNRWCEAEDVEPITCWAGFNVAPGTAPPSLERTREALDSGVACVWMPVFMHANTWLHVGGRRDVFDASAGPNEITPPLPWGEALEHGHYLLDEHGRLKPVIRDIMHLVADRGVALSLGHATHEEIWALVEEIEKLGFQQAFADHPFSPFVDLSVDEMKQLAGAGVYMNFTFDEISPLLGVDPNRMYEAIRAIGVEHVTLSSDCGEPLFPNSVEGLRLVLTHMRAFGLTAAEMREVSRTNPESILGAGRI
jgi:hypothetical protein